MLSVTWQVQDWGGGWCCESVWLCWCCKWRGRACVWERLMLACMCLRFGLPQLPFPTSHTPLNPAHHTTPHHTTPHHTTPHHMPQPHHLHQHTNKYINPAPPPIASWGPTWRAPCWRVTTRLATSWCSRRLGGTRRAGGEGEGSKCGGGGAAGMHQAAACDPHSPFAHLQALLVLGNAPLGMPFGEQLQLPL